MPDPAELDAIRAAARAHARQIDAVRFATVQQLAERWVISEDAVRAIPREQLPYLQFGRSRMRRYDPRDVERYEEAQKLGPEGDA